MAIRRYKPEQIVNLLRQIEVGIANGKPTPQACKEAEITVQTYYRWRKEYGGLKLDQAKRLKELVRENSKLKRLVAELSLEKQVLKDVAEGNFEALSGGRCAVEHAREECRMSERHACRLLGQWRGTQRYEPLQRMDEEALTAAISALASEHGRYGYRRITVKVRESGWQVSIDRVQRIWRREGLKVPQKNRSREGGYG
jgi:hypothetical protein